MPLGKHQRIEKGSFRRERGDSLLGNLSKEYPILGQFRSDMKLETLRNRLGVESLDQALKVLRSKR